MLQRIQKGLLFVAAAFLLSSTTNDLNLYVDPSGNDAGECLSAGSGACLTIQAAINKSPKSLRHRVIVNVAPGSYAGFVVSGFTTDIGFQRTTAGLMVQGTLTNSTGLTTGTATGTTTSSSAGSTNIFGTLVDTDQTWTAGNLRGRFVVVTSGTGSGQVKVIASNTTDTITIVGTWTAPTAGSTYIIQDSTSLITSCGTAPPSASGAVSTANTAVRVADNSAGSTVTLRGLSISAACSFGVVHADISSLVLNRLQFTSTAGTASRVQLGAGGYLVDTIASIYSGTTGTHIGGNPLAAVNASVLGNVGNIAGPAGGGGTVQNSLFVNGGTAVNLSNQRAGTIFSLEIIDAATIGIAPASVTSNLQGVNIDCTGASTAVGISLTSLAASGSVSPDHVAFTDCNTAVRVDGPTGFIRSAHALNATGVTTYFDVRNGGRATFTATPSGTVSGNEISLDSGALVFAFSDIPASTDSVVSLKYGSRVSRD